MKPLSASCHAGNVIHDEQALVRSVIRFIHHAYTFQGCSDQMGHLCSGPAPLVHMKPVTALSSRLDEEAATSGPVDNSHCGCTCSEIVLRCNHPTALADSDRARAGCK